MKNNIYVYKYKNEYYINSHLYVIKNFDILR